MSNTKKKKYISEKITQENLGEVYDTIDTSNVNVLNTFLNKKEELDGSLLKDDSTYSYLYPSLDDPNFNIKIAERKEFYDTKMDVPDIDIENIERQANNMCNADFELSPHQLFVRNFLSFETPYNSLLLYHGLGTGKTCSAISVAEEMRDYMKQMGIVQRIIIVASPIVQENFKLQLFDERKLQEVDGLWNLRACTGNKYLKEINPMNMKGFSKAKVIRQVERIINTNYLFLGYLEFANMIQRKTAIEDPSPEKIRRSLRKVFQNRLIIIDEVQNIRSTEENNTNKRVASELMRLIENVHNIRLLLLSATPMFNSYKEIIWLVNLMNLNDRRGAIGISEVFDKNGNFLISKEGVDVGMDLLRRKITGYISFVKGENPLTFPFRIFPKEFSPENTFQVIKAPTKQLNGKSIAQSLEHVDVFLNKIGSYQGVVYNKIIKQLKEKGETMPNFENMESFGYTLLQKPLMALNICYPSEDESVNPDLLIGNEGLEGFMDFTSSTVPMLKTNFEYKTMKFGRIFAPENIGKYSCKIKQICESLKNSTGIILIYTNYINGGAIPIALSLEEMGLRRYGSYAKQLFKSPPSEEVDAINFEKKSDYSGSTFMPAKYVIISGDKALSPNNKKDLIALTNEDNVNGEKVKVVIITKAGSEGLDFKNIRQVHILEPWYNMNLIEQVIGRAVRTCSHIKLPFIERNVQIFLYGTILKNEKDEAVDLYVYRLAELKAIQIGRVTRLLKESSVDCILNVQQNKYNAEVLQEKILQRLSDKKTIDFAIGNKPYSASCDYLKTCNYTCIPYKEITNEDVVMDTYSESFIVMNSDKIMQKIRDAFKEKYFYKKEELIAIINVNKVYPIIQINAALEQLINDRSEYLFDDYGRAGNLINIEDYYMFQPVELDNHNISIFDRSVPIPYKRKSFIVKAKELVHSPVAVKEKIPIDKKIINGMLENYKAALNFDKVLERGETNYYIFCSKIFQNFIKMGATLEIMTTLLIDHLCNSLMFDDALQVVNYLYFNIGLSEFEKQLKEYFDKYIIKAKNVVGLMLTKNNEKQLIVLDTESWKLGQSEDYYDLSGEIDKFIILKENMNRYVGFFTEYKSDFMIFKVIDLADPKNKGARCDQSGKNVAINLLNAIMGKEVYNKENTRGRNKMEFCVIQEYLLRLYNYQQKDDKIWFASPIEAINSF